MSDLIFPKPEPEKFEGKALKLGMELETIEHIHWRIEKEHYDLFNSVPQETRQEILDCWKMGRITIGQVAEKFNLSCDAVNSVIFLNLNTIYTLRKESL